MLLLNPKINIISIKNVRNTTILDCDLTQDKSLDLNESLYYKNLEMELIKTIFNTDYTYFISVRITCESKNGAIIYKSLKRKICLNTNKLYLLLYYKKSILQALEYYNVTNIKKITYIIHKYKL